MKLPDSRVFLIRLTADLDPSGIPRHQPVGRIEHVESGLRAALSSLDEICGFVLEVLDREALEEGPEELPR